MTAGRTRPGSFLAPPGEVEDWRRVLLLDAAHACGLPAHLPGPPATIAEAAGTDPEATRVLLDALEVHGAVRRDESGSFTWEDDAEDTAVTRHHARAIRRWATTLEDRLAGRETTASPPQALDVFLPALAVQARQRAGALVDRCLERFPDARSVLDVGGGHGEFSLEFARRGLDVTLQDLPPVIDYLRAEGRVEPAGVHLFAGDAHDVLPKSHHDLVLLAGITHIFDGDVLQRLFIRLRSQTAPDGVAVATMLRRHDRVAPLFAVQMCLNGRGGDTHAEDEYRAWLAGAGFADLDVASFPGSPAVLLLASGDGPTSSRHRQLEREAGALPGD